ncbi:hypothetical protein [uncultured Corynebacterium sp.]|uniref:hypothetical protein n=1 Tax=uncultured Corynebacterium sp. TaxID=159447 RepID=UPI0025E63D88|nr:hypothetical protein [uncultured Corynebacterium sp.]
MGLTPEQMLELQELSEAATRLDRDIQELLQQRQEISARAGNLTAIQMRQRQDEIKKASPATSDMDLELLSRWLITKVQRLEDENLIALKGRFRAPHIMPGMVPIMINDDGYCTQLVIHFDADHFQGMVGVSLEEEGRRTQAGYDEELHASTIIVALMGEFPITLAEQCQPGEIKWLFDAPGYPHPDNLGALIAMAQETGAWLHPQIDEIPHS